MGDDSDRHGRRRSWLPSHYPPFFPNLRSWHFIPWWVAAVLLVSLPAFWLMLLATEHAATTISLLDDGIATLLWLLISTALSYAILRIGALSFIASVPTTATAFPARRLIPFGLLLIWLSIAITLLADMPAFTQEDIENASASIPVSHSESYLLYRTLCAVQVLVSWLIAGFIAWLGYHHPLRSSHRYLLAFGLLTIGWLAPWIYNVPSPYLAHHAISSPLAAFLLHLCFYLRYAPLAWLCWPSSRSAKPLRLIRAIFTLGLAFFYTLTSWALWFPLT